MAKIVVNMESFASETAVTAVTEAINAALPAGMSATPAQQVRDANGKLVSVSVGIPLNATATERNTARDAALDNSDVAKSTGFPIEASEDFNTVTPGATISSPLLDASTPLTFTLSSSAAAKGAASVDSVGGTGSAFKLEDTDATSQTNHLMSVNMSASAGSWGLASYGPFVLDMVVKNPSGTDGDLAHNVTVQVEPVGAGMGGFELSANSFQPNWLISHILTGQVDTGVARTDAISVRMSVDAAGLAKIEELTSGSNFSASFSFGFAPSFTSLNIGGSVIDNNSVAADILQRPLIIDDLKITIEDGVTL